VRGRGSAGVHGAELEHREGLHAAPEAALAEQHRAARAELDGGRDDHQERQQEQDQEGGEADVERALGERPRAAAARLAGRRNALGYDDGGGDDRI
jgi:hypothetical protein